MQSSSSWIVVSAAFFGFFLLPRGLSQPFSARHASQVAAEEPISIVRVEDDLMVKWFCPALQKTSLLILDRDARWNLIDEACAAEPETQYHWVAPISRNAFFRTSSDGIQGFPRLRIITPSRWISALPTPVRVEVLRPDASVDREVWNDEVSLKLGAGGSSWTASLPVHNGIASGLFSSTVEGLLTVSFGGESAQRFVRILQTDITPAPGIAGELSDPVTIWQPGDGVIRVAGDVTVPAGHILRIYPDTIILLDPKKSITVHGAIESLGTVEHPVLFAASDPDNPWGQVSHADVSAKSIYRGTFFIRGGDSPPAGHTNKGPVVRFNNARIEFNHCTLMDNYGKGLYGTRGDLAFTSCLFSRCEMGMEIVDTDIVVDRCFFVEMPPGEEVEDHDALYLNGRGNMSVTNTIFALGGDDGIDTLSSFPLIEDCIIHGFADKGVSVYYGTTRIRNCLIVSNAYGISAKGDGTNVYVDGTTIARNKNQAKNGAGIRSHNKYQEPQAVIRYFVTNSIIWDNDQAVRTDYPLEHISITYSDVQGADLFPGTGNIAADPLFVDPDGNDFQLGEFSPCRGAGQDGADMGCVHTNFP